MNEGYAIIQLPDYLLSLFNYLKKKGKNHSIYGNKPDDSVITTQYNRTELTYANTAKSTAIFKHNNGHNLHERMDILELSMKNLESKLEEIINLISLK